MNQEIYIYNTLSGTKELFRPINPGKINMYVCGPTVYSNAHIGHALSAMVFDIIRRYFEESGYDVKFIMNFTDVDDKIINRSRNENLDPSELTKTLINEYIGQLKLLNIQPATHYPKATEEIGGMIAFIEGLINKGFAYAKDGDVFFRTNKFEGYGKLSGRTISEQISGSRIEVDTRKEQSEDFALWKSAKPGEPSWPSPWGEGRPGWHIECSSMCIKHLGEQIDIHGGGADLIFPHHENEIAQSESFTGKQFANYWMHNGMLELKGGKMSKSVGNLVTITGFLEDFGEANTFRMMVISSHYRSPLAFSQELADEAATKVEKIKNALKDGWGNNESDELKQEIIQNADTFFSNFNKAMSDDFNTPVALSHIFTFTKYINQLRDQGASTKMIDIARQKLLHTIAVLGFDTKKLTTVETGTLEPQLIELLIEIRKELRANKNWQLSDLLRNRLTDLGIILEDTPSGTSWKKA